VQLSELATYVAAREQETPPTAVTPDKRKKVSIGFVHNHLPKLADVGLIEWHPDQGQIDLKTSDDGDSLPAGNYEKREVQPGANPKTGQNLIGSVLDSVTWVSKTTAKGIVSSYKLCLGTIPGVPHTES
jgi:hypothetical protein